jgi:hypothetical protein
MKNVFLGVVVSVAMSAVALAQNAPASPPASDSANATSAANAPKIAPGSVIPVQLTKTVDAKKAKTGDQVVATVTMDLKNQSGEVLLPKQTKVIGHVTEAQARSKEQKESQLAIAFDQAFLKGEQVRMPMSIQAVVAPQNNNDDASSSVPSGTPTPGSPAGGSTSPMAGRPGGGQAQAQQPTPPPGDSGNPGGRLPPINGQTEGVIGISHVTLSAGSSPAEGSVLTSDKNNVKLESGTLLLLKVR